VSSHDDTDPVDPVLLSAVVMLRHGPNGTLPDPAAVEALRSAFERLGFDVGPAVALSFSISGPDGLFDDRFPSTAPTLELLGSGSGDAASSGEIMLSLDDLDPRDDLTNVTAIFFPERPDFGPGNP
jgi:hypothetical protein